MKLNCNTCNEVVDRTYAFAVVKCFSCKQISNNTYVKKCRVHTIPVKVKKKTPSELVIEQNQMWCKELAEKYKK